MVEIVEAHVDEGHNCFLAEQYVLDAKFSSCLCTSTKTALFFRKTPLREIK